MPAARIIPCLDVADGQVVKGVQFRDHRVIGDIVEHARRYADEGADELVFYDITASPEGRSVDTEWVRRVSETIDIPFCVAGGIRSVEAAGRVLAQGADKISIKDGIRLREVTVDTVDEADRTITLVNLSALVLRLNNQTEISDDRDTPAGQDSPCTAGVAGPSKSTLHS